MKITKDKVKELAIKYKINLKVVSLNQLQKGMNVELEHIDVTKGDLDKTFKIVLAHLKESIDYYDKLKKVEKNNIVKNIFLR